MIPPAAAMWMRARRWPGAMGCGLALLALLYSGGGCGRKTPDSSGGTNTIAEASSAAPTAGTAGEFQRVSTQGRALMESGNAEDAVTAFQRAVELQPTHPDARQNLANALLRAERPDEAATHARELIRLNQNLAAAHFILGAALLRQGMAEEALQALQTSKDIDHTVNATSYLLGRAHQELGQWEEAAALYEEVLEFEPDHPAANYNLSQALARLGRSDEAAQAIERHRATQEARGNAPIDSATVEAGEHTVIRVPFELAPPDPDGVPVRFVDATEEILGDAASRFSGPMALIDIKHDNAPDVFARESDGAFRLLLNSGGRLTPAANAVAVPPGGGYRQVLVGDLNRDRYEDIIVLGEQGLRAFRLATNGVMTDSTAFSNLRDLPAVGGLLADLDFTGNLDLVLITPTNRAPRVMRNLGNMYFTNATASSGFPEDLAGIQSWATDDWNGDELNDFLIGLESGPIRVLNKLRGGPLTNAPTPEAWPQGSVFAVGDLNNDLRNDVVIATGDRLMPVLSGFREVEPLTVGASPIRAVRLLDYDNDGWLDVLAIVSDGLRAWRNIGDGRFVDATSRLGLGALSAPDIESLAFGDMDNDGDTDIVAALATGGLRVFRNEGGNANRQLKLRLLGTRSNSSGLGLRIELSAGNWRAMRTVRELPIEIGVGSHERIDTLNVRWFDALSTEVDTPVEPGRQLALIELVRPTGSCPYLYRWDGQRFAFVTDLLGGSPVGLPAAEGFYIAADTDEIVQVGTEENFIPRDGMHVLQITEELRELLYLDVARLIVVDHPEGTEAHPTDKLVPGRPFPPSEIHVLRPSNALRHAEDLEGADVTAALLHEDRRMVSPRKLRPPQQRGYAEPHGMVLDFGPLDSTKPIALVMTGWLRFGGGMANMAASRDPEVGFPFPRLEVEAGGEWRPVDVVVGAPCGKTKTILVDLQGRLPKGAGRLRLTMEFEIHWDRVALMERVSKGEVGGGAFVELTPDTADLHWRGYAEFEDLPWTQPLTPIYEKTRSWPDWRITPSGWCTRYGRVEPLVTERDGGLLILNGGDELTLSFAADRIPPRPEGMRRTFFLFTVGWDKDADFHVRLGDQVGPLPWEGMDDQLYGFEERPPHPGDQLNRRFNTRWVSPMAQIRRHSPDARFTAR